MESSLFLLEKSEKARRLDAGVPSDRLSLRVRQTLYQYALIRNGWGTTNIDAGPIELARVEELYRTYKAGAVRPGRVLPTEVEVLNYFRLVEDLPRASFPLSKDDLRQLHREYFAGVPLQNDAKPGQWKTQDNVVVGPHGVLETTPKERVQKDLDELLTWLNGPSQNLPVLARSAYFFHEFQRIHPFGDGNGRLGRLATLTVLAIGGLPNIRYCPIDDTINEDRGEYYAGLEEADVGRPERWANYFASTVVDGYVRIHLLGDRLQRIPPNLEAGGQELLEWVYIHKAASFRFREARVFFPGASDKTVQRRLRDLEGLGLVKRSGRGEATRYAVASLHEVRRPTSD
ncbi:MAG: Fic family protein [Euryarchaeota archaeon]|nr:Fic family protein [Euryarchaeota archaeon]